MKYEISHDTLAKQIHEKAGADVKARRRIKAMVEREMKRLGTLLRQEDIDELNPFEDVINFNSEELAFIEQSKTALLRAAKRKRRALIATIVSLSALALVSMIFAFSAWIAAQKVEAKAREGMANDLAFKAEVEPDRTTAFRLAELAHKIDPGNQKALQQLLNLTNPDLRQSVHSTFYGTESVGTIADFSKDGSIVAIANHPFSLSAWEIESGKLIVSQKFSAKEAMDSATVIKFSPDDLSIILGSMSGNLILLDVNKPDDFSSIDLGETPILSLDLSPDGRKIAAGFDDGTVKSFDFESGEKQFLGHKDPVEALAFKDSVNLYSFSRDGNLRHWNVKSGKLVFTKEFGTPAIINYDARNESYWSSTPSESFWNPVFTDNGNMIYSSYIWSQYKYIDIAAGEKKDSEEARPFQLQAYSYSFDGNYSVKLGMDSLYFDNRKEETLIRNGNPQDLTGSVAVSEYGNRFWTSTESTNERIWNPSTNTGLYTILTGDLRSGKFNSNFNEFLETTGEKELNLINLSDGTEERITIDIDDLRISEVVDYQLNHALIKTDTKFQLELWNLKTRTREWKRKEISVYVKIKMLSPDGSLFAVASDNGIDIWDTRKDELITKFGESSGSITSAAFCRCENFKFKNRSKHLMLIGSDSKLALLWDPRSGKVLNILPAHAASVTKVGFTRNEDMAITGDSKGNIIFWAFDKSDPPQAFEELVIQTNRGSIIDFAHSVFGDKIAVVSTGTKMLNVTPRVDIYDVKSGNLTFFLTNDLPIEHVAFTNADNSLVISDYKQAQNRSIYPDQIINDFKNKFNPSYLSVAALNKYELYKMHEAKKGYFKNLYEEMDEEKMINISDYYIELARTTSNFDKKARFHDRAVGILSELLKQEQFSKLTRDQIKTRIEKIRF